MSDLHDRPPQPPLLLAVVCSDRRLFTVLCRSLSLVLSMSRPCSCVNRSNDLLSEQTAYQCLSETTALPQCLQVYMIGPIQGK